MIISAKNQMDVRNRGTYSRSSKFVMSLFSPALILAIRRSVVKKRMAAKKESIGVNLLMDVRNRRVHALWMIYITAWFERRGQDVAKTAKCLVLRHSRTWEGKQLEGVTDAVSNGITRRWCEAQNSRQ